MAFPGTYDFSYYKGDTLEFRIYPKDASGTAFDLADFGNATFTLAQSRGSTGSSTSIEAYASIDSTADYILCAIRPADAESIDATKTYVYDVEITKSGSPYPLVYTVLTGTITIKDQVSGA